MTASTKNPIAVQKEQIAALKFPAEEVLHSPDDIRLRQKQIEQAMLLGNNYKGKVKIVFEDAEGLKQVETTIWGMTDKRIILKSDLVIPFHRVHEVII